MAYDIKEPSGASAAYAETTPTLTDDPTTHTHLTGWTGAAEFREVMKQACRLCDTAESCKVCALSGYHETSMCELLGNSAAYGRFEAIVITWAKEHPESRYPTWGEWFAENFPSGNSSLLNPCAFIGKKFCEGHLCYECKQQPIPAEIAEKLGVKPKGAKE